MNNCNCIYKILLYLLKGHYENLLKHQKKALRLIIYSLYKYSCILGFNLITNLIIFMGNKLYKSFDYKYL